MQLDMVDVYKPLACLETLIFQLEQSPLLASGSAVKNTDLLPLKQVKNVKE